MGFQTRDFARGGGELSIIGVVRAPVAIANFVFFVWGGSLLKPMKTQESFEAIISRSTSEVK